MAKGSSAYRAHLAAGLLTVGLAVSGCAGGGNAAHQTPALAAPTPSSAPAPQAKLGQASVTIKIPAAATGSAAARKPAFISASAQSLSISSYAVAGGVPTGPALATSNQNLTATSPGCVGSGPVECTVTVAAPIGQAAFSVAIYQGLNQTGALLSSLPQSAATVFTIAEGSTNVVLPLILNGVPATVTVAPQVTSVNGGVSATIPLSVVAQDAGGNIIIGPGSYANAITLTNTDGSGSTALTATTITSPGQAVSLTYNGGNFASPLTLSATVSGATVTPGTVSLIPGPLTIGCSSGCGVANLSTPYNETISEGGYGSGSFTLSGSGTSCTFDPATSVSATNGAANVNIYGDPAGGTCTLTISDTNTQNGTATVTFSAAAVPSPANVCGDLLPKPVDPFGGFLYVNSCSNTGVQYGSYLAVPLDSSYNPPSSFVVAVYANTSQQPVYTFVNNTNRYESSVSVSSPTSPGWGKTATPPSRSRRSSRRRISRGQAISRRSRRPLR